MNRMKEVFWTKPVNQKAKKTSRANHDFCHPDEYDICPYSDIKTSFPVFNAPVSLTEAAKQFQPPLLYLVYYKDARKVTSSLRLRQAWNKSLDSIKWYLFFPYLDKCVRRRNSTLEL